MTLRELGWPTGLTLGITLMVALIWLTGSPTFVTANFPLAFLGLGLMVVAVWLRRRWWLLLCGPMLLAPFYMPAVLLAACLNGDCL